MDLRNTETWDTPAALMLWFPDFTLDRRNSQAGPIRVRNGNLNRPVKTVLKSVYSLNRFRIPKRFEVRGILCENELFCSALLEKLLQNLATFVGQHAACYIDTVIQAFILHDIIQALHRTRFGVVTAIY